MKHYWLLVVGENFPMMMDGQCVLMGWSTARWVEATDPEEAKAKVLDTLRADPTLADTPRDCGATISWEEIEEVDESEIPATPIGFAFFPMDQQSAT